jgi:beta-lactam-binding protein with PASTA domain
VVRPGSEEIPLLSQFEPQTPRSSIGFSAPSPEQITGAQPIVNAFPRASRTPAVGSSPPRGPIGRTPRFERTQYDLPRTTSRRGGFLIAAVVIVVLAIAAGVVWKLGVFKSSYAVPNLVGQTTKQASSAISSDGFTLVVKDVNSATVPTNEIVSQTPIAGAKAKSGSVIDVNVSKGPSVVTLPRSLIGETCNQAAAQLTALHVSSTCPASRRVYSNVIPANHVYRVLYGRTVNPLVVPKGASVILQRSKGTPVATTTTTAPATTTTTAPTGTTTTTTTMPASTGTVAVPNVVGDDYSQTVAAFKKAVLYFTTTGHDAGTTKWTKVLSENPGAGTSVPYKSSVTLTVQ